MCLKSSRLFSSVLILLLCELADGGRMGKPQFRLFSFFVLCFKVFNCICIHCEMTEGMGSAAHGLVGGGLSGFTESWNSLCWKGP